MEGVIRISASRAGRTRSRAARLAEIALLGAAMLLLLFAAAAPALRTQVPKVRITTVRVQANDTLWAIASRHPIPGGGVEETVRRIRELNRMSNSDLAAGQVLRVPDTASSAVVSR